MLDGTRVPLRLALPGRWNLANAALAVTAATTHFGVDPDDAAAAAATITTVAGRYMAVALPDGRRARVLLAKNPAGWSEVLRHLGPPTRGQQPVVIAVNARVADGKDPSWLWDVPTSCCAAARRRGGRTRLDVAVRLATPTSTTRRARPARGGGQAPRRRVNIVASYTQFSALYRRFG